MFFLYHLRIVAGLLDKAWHWRTTFSPSLTSISLLLGRSFIDKCFGGTKGETNCQTFIIVLLFFYKYITLFVIVIQICTPDSAFSEVNSNTIKDTIEIPISKCFNLFRFACAEGWRFENWLVSPLLFLTNYKTFDILMSLSHRMLQLNATTINFMRKRSLPQWDDTEWIFNSLRFVPTDVNVSGIALSSIR